MLNGSARDLDGLHAHTPGYADQVREAIVGKRCLMLIAEVKFLPCCACMCVVCVYGWCVCVCRVVLWRSSVSRWSASGKLRAGIGGVRKAASKPPSDFGRVRKKGSRIQVRIFTQRPRTWYFGVLRSRVGLLPAAYYVQIQEKLSDQGYRNSKVKIRFWGDRKY